MILILPGAESKAIAAIAAIAAIGSFDRFIC
jgi:hypothetical protein